MSKFYPIFLVPAGFYCREFSEKKLFGLSVDKYCNFRLLIENEDKTFSQKLRVDTVRNLSSWLDLTIRSVVHFYREGIYNVSHTLFLTEDIKLVLECNCNEQRNPDYRFMLNVISPAGHQLFNISGKQKYILPIVEGLIKDISSNSY